MAEQSFLNKLGMRLGIVGSSVALAIAAPIAAGDYSTTAHTAANRTGAYFDQTAAAEVIGFVVGGQAGPTFTRSGTATLLAIPGTDTSHTLGNCQVGFLATGSTGDAFFSKVGAAITDPYFRARTNGSAVMNAATAGACALRVNNVDVVNVQAVTQTTTQAAATSGSASGFVYTAGAHTTLTSATETLDISFNLARTVQWATNVPTTQRAFLISGPTYACDTALKTITTAGTLVINGQPLPGTNVTITNAYALWVQAGKVAISDTTASTTTAGALLIGTGTAATTVTIGGGSMNVGSALTVGTNLTCTGGATGRIRSQGAAVSADLTGTVSFWRSGGTIGLSGDMVFQSDLATDGNFVFRNGVTTPQTIVTIGSATSTGTTPAIITTGTSAFGGVAADGYTGGLRIVPSYSGGTVTRYNYLDLNQPTGGGTFTNAAVMRFDAAIGTHKALNAATTKTTPSGVDAWVLINANGTIMFMPAYLSKTA